MDGLANALIASGWLISSEDFANAINALPIGEDVLPLLAGAALKASRTNPGTSVHSPFAEVLIRERARGAALTLGWPENAGQPFQRWLGPRLLWWPRGVPAGRKVAWVSSRLGRAIDERSDWFSVLRSAATKLDPESDLLLTVPGTTVDRFLERAAILFGLRCLRVHLDEHRMFVDWLTRLRRQIWRSDLSREAVERDAPRSSEVDRLKADVFLSPAFGNRRDNSDGHECPSSELPLSDRVLISAASKVFAVQVRANGNLHQLLRARLSDFANPTASVWLALGESLVPADVANELQSLGAVGWWLLAMDDSGVRLTESMSEDADARRTDHEPLTEVPWLDGDYLVHWTRRRDGSWPDQSETDYLDNLLLSRESTNHSAFAVLSRIVQQRRLIATSKTIRGACSVVSFSAMPLSAMPRQRAYRTHRGRWDCDTYGLCIRRDWLQARGAKPVIYGDDANWAALPVADRPFFQLKATRSRRGQKVIDWTQEAEWRVPQDVDLSEAKKHEVVIFVPTDSEARQLTAISPWPVLAVSNATSQSSSAIPATKPRC